MMTADTLYSRLGGEDAIDKATGLFYDAVLADPSLAGYFEGVDMQRQQAMLTAFVSMAAGGPSDYEGRSLRDAHAHLGIGDEEFDAVLAHLAAALSTAGVPADGIGELAAVAETVRADVLGR